MKLNAAGRFWVANAFLLLSGLIYSVHSHAGFYASVTASGNDAWKPIGTVSGCYLTLAMAIYSLAPYAAYPGYQITSLNDTTHTWSGYLNSPTSYPGSGSWGNCDAVPTGGPLIPLSPGISDPGIVPGGIAGSGGSTSVGSIEEMEALFGWSADLFELGVGGALLVFATGFGVGLIANMVRRARTL